MKDSSSAMPLWAQLRIEHGFAQGEEVACLQALIAKPASRHMADCAPSGCEKSGNTGGCKPGTSCLFSALQ